MFQLQPITFNIGEYTLPVISDFRTALNALDTDDVHIFISLLCPRLMDVLNLMRCEENLNDVELIQYIQEFVLHIKSELFGIQDTTDIKQTQKILDFKKDQHILMASFKQAYNINIYEEDLDYRMFIELVKNLTKTKMNFVWEVRTMDIPKGASSKERMQIQELKVQYRLDSDNNEVDSLELARQILNEEV